MKRDKGKHRGNPMSDQTASDMPMSDQMAGPNTSDTVPVGEPSDMPVGRPLTDQTSSDIPSAPIRPPVSDIMGTPEMADLPRQSFLRGGPVKDKREGYQKGNAWKSPKGF